MNAAVEFSRPEGFGLYSKYIKYVRACHLHLPDLAQTLRSPGHKRTGGRYG